MTALRNSQLSVTSVDGGVGNLNASQLSVVTIGSNPAAAGLRVSELYVVSVIANGQGFKPMGPVIGLGCWTPCGTLLFNGE